ncbi:MAG: hypothetical protein HYU53_17010 [Acidobacteria bacterium]|nr:hypothetical protein [Acidobacteriota bacterium]
METRLLIELTDLKSISFVCRQCGARVSRSPERADRIPTVCGECQHPWHQTLESTATDFAHALTALRRGNGTGFKIVLEVEAPK